VFFSYPKATNIKKSTISLPLVFLLLELNEEDIPMIYGV